MKLQASNTTWIHSKSGKNCFYGCRVFSVFILLSVSSTLLIAQGKKTTEVELKQANAMKYDKKIGPNIKILVGDVILKHDDAIMYCDSAVKNDASNSFDAFGNVHINQGDTLDVYGDVLFYDGNTKLAKLRRNVKMINRETTLTTQKFNYDMAEDVGYYIEGGKIVDSLNTVVSEEGTYYPQTDIGFFYNDVVVTNPDVRLYTDTLQYSTKVKMASILGPTTITDDTTVLYAEKGYYKSIEKYAFIHQNASITRLEHYISGDTLTYNRYLHDAFAFGNVYMKDTSQNSIITGNYGYFNDSLENSLVTDSAVLMLYDANDTLFLHADTLQSVPDTTGFNILKAHHSVRFFRKDLQGKCDSMSITMLDTVVHMYFDPVIWAKYNQLSGEIIEIFNKNGTTDRIELTDKAFMASMEDSTRYNQIKGKKIIAKIENQALRKIDVDGNAQTVYYAKDGPYIIGMNKAESSYLVIYLKENTVDQIIMHPQPTGRMLPNKRLNNKEVELLDGFAWMKYLRPSNRFDIFKRND